MAEIDIDIAIEDLDEMSNVLTSNIKSGGFDNQRVMWLIKAWVKIAILAHGPGYHKMASGYYGFKREPAKDTQKRSKTLLQAVDGYQGMLKNSRTTGGDAFDRVDKAMLNFVWEYRKNISGKTENEFVHLLQKWQALSEDEVMKQEVFQMDRAA